jgi:hypothetical protein
MVYLFRKIVYLWQNSLMIICKIWGIFVNQISAFVRMFHTPFEENYEPIDEDAINQIERIDKIKIDVINVYIESFKDPYESQMNQRVWFDELTQILYVEYTGHKGSDFENGVYYFSLQLNKQYDSIIIPLYPYDKLFTE